MSAKYNKQQLQNLIKLYKKHTGKSEVELREVARYAVDHYGVPLPEPTDPLEILTKKFSAAAREETKVDKQTGRVYRVNHALHQPGSQTTLWIDIDSASRSQMKKSLTTRRNQIIGDALQLDLDAEHWNNINPHEEPIQMILDFKDDVEERKHVIDLDEAANDG